MIKKYLFILFCLQWSPLFAQFTVTIQWATVKPANNSDTIYYNPQQKLSWADFKGKPDAKSPAAAVTESGFGYRLTMNAINNKIDVIVTVFCYFDKRKSWVKKEMDNAYALTHEQHHYDITYINACLCVNKLKQAQYNNKNFSKVVERIHDESFESLSKMQDAYDGETANGRIKNIQLQWNKKIDTQLTTLPID